MFVRYIKPILLVTGLITLLTVIKFLIPSTNFFPGIELVGEGAQLIVRHLALEIGIVGGLLMYAAFKPAVRVPVLVAAIIGKAGMVYLLLRQLGNPTFDPMRGVLYFDALCVVLFVLCLLQARGGKHT